MRFILLVLALFSNIDMGPHWDPLGGTSSTDSGCAIDPLGGCRG